MPILMILVLSTQSFAAATSQDMLDPDDDLPEDLYPKAGAEQCALLLVAVVQLPT